MKQITNALTSVIDCVYILINNMKPMTNETMRKKKCFLPDDLPITTLKKMGVIVSIIVRSPRFYPKMRNGL